MDAQSSVYSEKKLAFYETAYKENVISKPQEINLTVTAANLYGLAFICDQIGTKEGDPMYTRFTCGLNEITKVYINTNNKNSPIYIQCDAVSKATINRRRIILPSFGAKNDEIVEMITNVKTEFDAKADKIKEIEYNQKKIAIENQSTSVPNNFDRARRAIEDEFDSMTADFKNSMPASVTSSKKSEQVEEVAPVEMVFAETKPAVPKSEFTSEDIVSDMLGIDEILSEISSSMVTSNANEIEFDTLDLEASELEFDMDSIPEEIFQKEPAEIEELIVPVIDDQYEEIPVENVQIKHEAEIEEIDTEKIIKQKLEEKKKKAEAVQNEVEKVEEPINEAENSELVVDENPPIEPAPAPAVSPINVAEPVANSPAATSLSLEEFETAVKKLKIMLDTGAITENEFAIEKKKLLSTLY